LIPKRILIVGATGLLGKALVQEWDFDEVTGASSRDADVRDLSQLRTLFARTRPQWTVLAAAYTDVDGCEKNPEMAHQVNCAGAGNVASAARECGSRLLFVSTDYVFDGKKAAPYETSDMPKPINVYGRTKAAGEAMVRAILPEACMARTSWLFGVDGKCFPNTILRLAEEQREISVVADQRGSPTFNRDLARTIMHLCRSGARGTLHVTNSGHCSWHEFAEELVRVAGLTKVTVKPVGSQEFARPAARPKNSVLSPASLRQRYGITLPPWQEAVQRYLHEKSVCSLAQESHAGCRFASVPGSDVEGAKS
jgi:dTDP-4-dehydrorhamnose reductase